MSDTVVLHGWFDLYPHIVVGVTVPRGPYVGRPIGELNNPHVSTVRVMLDGEEVRPLTRTVVVLVVASDIDHTIQYRINDGSDATLGRPWPVGLSCT